MKSENKINLSDDAMNFLLYSYFEMDLDDLKEKDHQEIIWNCAKRAYRDLNRTLHFSTKSDSERQKFRVEICDIIRDEVSNLLEEVDKVPFDNRFFDDLHKEICNNIMYKCQSFKTETDDTTLLITKNKNTTHHTERDELNFSYGQAQKWLNMTLKYMWLLGLWEKEFEKILPVLHVPVDSYIIEKAWEYPDVTLPCEDKKRKQKYGNEKVTSWSKWNDEEDEEYKNFQTSLREILGEQNPIEWECSAWIEIAKKRREKREILAANK